MPLFSSPSNFSPPIAIGGLGGSGTRVFANLLQAAGVRIGDCLNQPLDNLWFTILFKRAAWVRSQIPTSPQSSHSQPRPDPAAPNPADVLIAIRLFHRAMTTGLGPQLSPTERAVLDSLRADLPPKGNWNCGARVPHADSLIASQISHHITDTQTPDGAQQPWGWKEPNTHIFLSHLDRHIPDFRYIHVVRDGLDMAFSKNTWQARHWGHLYNLPPIADTPLPLHQLRYWNAANRVAIDYGYTHMPGRFLVVHYEDFCIRPAAHWARILRFLGLPAPPPLPDGLVQPSTIGRSAEHGLSIFPHAERTEARTLQDIIETIGQPNG